MFRRLFDALHETHQATIREQEERHFHFQSSCKTPPVNLHLSSRLKTYFRHDCSTVSRTCLALYESHYEVSYEIQYETICYALS